jgi:ribosomal protein S18 acetylase RimI-like enzyme
MDPTIRYRPEALHYLAFRELNTACFPHEPIGPVAFARYVEEDYWVAYESGRPVAFCLMSHSKSKAHIVRIGVVPSRRRRGIGKALMGRMLRRARALSLPLVDLSVQQDNAAAVALYGAFGFSVVDRSVQFLADIKSPHGGEPVAIPLPEALADPRWRVPNQWLRLLQTHSPPHTWVLVFADQDDLVGIARFNTELPGCSPFALWEPKTEVGSLLAALHPYAVPDRQSIRITTDDPSAITALREAGHPENYRLFRMERVI